MEQLNIVEVTPANDLASGDYIYRTTNPFSALALHPGVERVVCITALHPRRERLMRLADVLVLNGICDPDFLPLIAERTAASLPTVYEIRDDVSALQSWNPIHSFYAVPENQRLVYKTISLCALLEANNRVLLARFGHLSPRTALFPNHLATMPPRPQKPRDRGERLFTVGWGGSHGHREDLRAIAAPLIRWLNETPGVRLALMCSEPIWHLFDALASEKKVHIEVGSLGDYYRFLQLLDVGLAPLCDTPFNRTRSDVKFIEYAAYGAAAVVQRSQPYQDTVRHGENGLLYDTPEELVQHLVALERDDAQRQRLCDAAYTYVHDTRQEMQHVEERLACYRGLLKLRPTTRLDPPPPTEVPAVPTMFEQLMYQGLVLMETGASRTEAEALFRQASVLEPESYLPHVLLGKIADNAEAELCLALVKNPRSLRAHLMLAEHYLAHGAVKKAIEQYQAASFAMGDWEVPHRALAALLEKLGARDIAARLLSLAEATTVRL